MHSKPAVPYLTACVSTLTLASRTGMNSPSRKAKAESGAAPRRSEAGLVSSCTMRTPYAVRGPGAAPPTAVPTRFGHCDRIGSGQTGGVTPSTPSGGIALGGAYGETCDGSVPGDRAQHPYRLCQARREAQPDWRGAMLGLLAHRTNPAALLVSRTP